MIRSIESMKRFFMENFLLWQKVDFSVEVKIMLLIQYEDSDVNVRRFAGKLLALPFQPCTTKVPKFSALIFQHLGL